MPKSKPDSRRSAVIQPPPKKRRETRDHNITDNQNIINYKPNDLTSNNHNDISISNRNSHNVTTNSVEKITSSRDADGVQSKVIDVSRDVYLARDWLISQDGGGVTKEVSSVGNGETDPVSGSRHTNRGSVNKPANHNSTQYTQNTSHQNKVNPLNGDTGINDLSVEEKYTCVNKPNCTEKENQSNSGNKSEDEESIKSDTELSKRNLDILSAAVSSSGILHQNAAGLSHVQSCNASSGKRRQSISESGNGAAGNTRLWSSSMDNSNSYTPSDIEQRTTHSKEPLDTKTNCIQEEKMQPDDIHAKPALKNSKDKMTRSRFASDDFDSDCTTDVSEGDSDTTNESTKNANLATGHRSADDGISRQLEPSSSVSSLSPGQHNAASIGPMLTKDQEKKQSFVSRRTCTYCGKVCFKPSDLQRHLLVHTGERPHKCEFCSRAFKSKGSLLYHRRVNHEASDTSLSVCLQEKYLRHKQSLARRMRKAEEKKDSSYKILRSHLEGAGSPRPPLMENSIDNLWSLVGGSKIDLENSIAYQTFAPLIPNGDADTPLDSLRQVLANQDSRDDIKSELGSIPSSDDVVRTTSTTVTSPLLGLATVASSLDRIAGSHGNRETYHHDDARYYDEKWYRNISDGGYSTILRDTLQKKCSPCSETGVCPGHCRSLGDHGNSNNNNNSTNLHCDVSKHHDNHAKVEDVRDEVKSEKSSQNESIFRSDSAASSDCKSMTNVTETRIISLVQGIENGHYVCFHKCHQCGKKIKSMKQVKAHLAKHNAIWRQCPICHVTFKFDSNLQKHLESEHEVRNKNSKLNSINAIESSSVKSEPQELSKGAVSVNHTGDKLINSERTQGKRREGVFKCKYCRKTFYRLYCLQRHERVHTGIKTCFCRKCGRGFSELRNLRHHILRFHAGLDRSELIKLLSNGSGPKKSETESICKKFIITSSQVAKHSANSVIDTLASTGGVVKVKPEVSSPKPEMRKDMPVFYPDLYLSTSYPLPVAPLSSAYPSMALPHLAAPPVPVFAERAPPIFPVMDYSRYHQLLSPTTSTSTSSSHSSGVLLSPTRLTPLHQQYVNAQQHQHQQQQQHKHRQSVSTTSPDLLKPESRSNASNSPTSQSADDAKKKGNNFSKHSSRYKSRLDIVRDAVKTEAAYQPVMSLDGRSVYKCPYCPKTFVGASDLTRHLNFHADLRPYKCELCEYSAKTNSQLKVHMRRHQGIREFKCSLCNYEGVTRSDLNRHFRSQTHINLTVEKQYQGLDANASSLTGGNQSGTVGVASAEQTGGGLDLTKWRHHTTTPNHYSKHQYRCAACDFEGHSQDDLRTHLLSETHLAKMVKKHEIKVEREHSLAVTVAGSRMMPDPAHLSADHTLVNGHVMERPSVVTWRPRSADSGGRSDVKMELQQQQQHVKQQKLQQEKDLIKTEPSDNNYYNTRCGDGPLDYTDHGNVKDDVTKMSNDSNRETTGQSASASGGGGGSEKPVLDHHENSDTEDELSTDPVIVIDG